MEEPGEVCITLDFLVETSSDLCGCFERGKELKESPNFCGHLNNEDVGAPLWGYRSSG